MKRTNKIILVVAVVAVLLLGVGYAAIQNVTLNIGGTATADPSQANFGVEFSGTPVVSDADKVTAAITDETNATINVEGLTAKGESVTATYTVQNVSDDLSADLSVATTNSNTEYFTISSELAKTSLVAGEATTLLVTVELTKTPITGEQTSTIGVQLTAMPVQPGEEGTSEGINGSSQTPEPPVETITLATLTNDNIGDYIDLGNNIVGTEATTDDWRVLGVSGDVVYVILAEYLPNSTNYAANAGLNTSGTYSVYSTSTDSLITGLTTESNWSGLANGISGAKVTGSPTAGLLMTSYNTKNQTSLIYTNMPSLDNSTTDYDLYVPHTSTIDSCNAYWMASPNTDNSMVVWNVYCNGGIYCTYYGNNERGIRPVAALPSSTSAQLLNGVWTIVK